MEALARLESWLQGAVEGTTRRLTGQRLQPVEIARQVAVAMDDGILVTANRPLAPNRYVVTLGEADHAALAGALPALEREFARFVEEEAPARGYRLAAPAVVEVRRDPTQRAGRMTVVATHESAASDDLVATTRALPVAARAAAVHGALVLAFGERAWTIGPGTRLVVGRDPACEIVIDDESVSRRHAVIAWQDLGRGRAAIEVEDLGSTNGTRVDGRPVHVAVVRAGSTVEFGSRAAQVTRAPST